MKKLLILLIVFSVVIQINTIQACTAFLLKHNDSYVVGRNYDFHSNQGLIMINPRNIQKTAISFPGEVSATWIAKYGSVTFNFLGREEPMEGINEKGLMIAALFLPETKLPAPDNRPIVDDMQWIQYMLDNCANIEEVISKLENVRISNQSQTRIHYFLSDENGNFAIIEFIEGKCIYYLNDKSTNYFICNASFENSSNYLKQYTGWGGETPLTDVYKKKTAEDVVVIGADLIKNYNGEENIETYAFNILKQVEAPRTSPNYGSHWSVVFDCKNKSFSFKTLDNAEKRTIDLKAIDFDCNQNIKALSIVESKAEDIYSQFNVFSADENLKMFKEGVRIFINSEHLPPDLEKEIESVANIPYTYKCTIKE